MAYRNLLRVRVAAELLSHTNLSVGEIAERLGFSVPSELYRSFRKVYRLSPAEYKKSHGL